MRIIPQLREAIAGLVAPLQSDERSCAEAQRLLARTLGFDAVREPLYETADWLADLLAESSPSEKPADVGTDK